MMSSATHVFVYIASFWLANEHLSIPHGYVIRASHWGPITAKPCPLSAMCTAQLAHSTPGFYTDNITCYEIHQMSKLITCQQTRLHLQPGTCLPHSVKLFCSTGISGKCVYQFSIHFITSLDVSAVSLCHLILLMPFVSFHRQLWH